MAIEPVNNKERIPLEHYQRIYQTLDPVEVSKRCNIPYDENSQRFTIRLMGTRLHFHFPDFKITDLSGVSINDAPASILLIRYLIEGRYFDSTDKLLTYRDIPGGELYYQNFLGRCIKRLAFAFGFNLATFSAVLEKLGAEKLDMGDCAYKFEFIDNLRLVFILWAGDDEFPPSSQILFENNFPFAFTAEDIAVVGDISIGTLKKMSAGSEKNPAH